MGEFLLLYFLAPVIVLTKSFGQLIWLAPSGKQADFFFFFLEIIIDFISFLPQLVGFK